MITDDEVLALFERADPARTDGAADAFAATGDLDTLRTRSTDVTITENPPPTTHRQLPLRRMAAAAAAILVVVGVIALTRNGDSDDPTGLVPAGEPTTAVDDTKPLATKTVPPPEPSVATADEVALEYLAAFAQRDPNAVMALESDDFVLRFAYHDGGLIEPGEVGYLSRLQQAASGVEYADPECSIAEESPSESVVSCTARLRLAQHQAAGSLGVAVDVTVVLTPDGVRQFDAFHQEGLVSYLQAFDDWADLNCPSLQGDATTADEQIVHGLAEAECADDWNRFAVSEIPPDVVAELDTGDLDSFFAHFETDAPILGVPADAAEATFTAFVASSAALDVTACAPNLVRDRAMNVACDVVLTDAGGLETTGSLTLLVGPDGIITSSDTTLDIPNV